MWDPSYDIARGLEPLKAPYKRAVAAARDQGGILFVSLLNDNQGKGTYGSKRKEWAHHATLANDALAFIISCGPANVWVQPVAETRTEWGKRFEQAAIAKLNAAGFMTVYNRGSRPTAPALGADRNAYHPEDISRIGTEDDVLVTDVGKFIGQVQVGGINGTCLNDPVVGAYALKVHQAGRRDLLIYTFVNVKKLTASSCEAVGKAWK
jgi:hypothetical protein